VLRIEPDMVQPRLGCVVEDNLVVAYVEVVVVVDPLGQDAGVEVVEGCVGHEPRKRIPPDLESAS
jgi:hypothetical protein